MPLFDKHPELLVRQREPFNAGPPPELVRRHEVTPTELFFVRNHGAVPEVDPAAFRLTVKGLVERELSLSLGDLASFPRATVAATIQCAGNRRLGLAAVAPTPGELPWDVEAISHGVWAGVPLAGLLAEAGVRPDARHVELVGLDLVERQGKRFGFGGSIPLAKALSGEVLLADQMNGLPLPPVHGFPLRAVVPGWIGARSVKWLAEITVQEEPSANYFQARAYRLFPPGVGPETVAWETGLMLGEVPVSSVICTPRDGAAVPPGPLEVEGWAFGGREVARVDVSTDGGRTWTTADLLPGDGPWSWRFFRATVELPRGEREIVARAVDCAAQSQPEDVRSIWNFKGYANNAWHRVRVTAG